MGLTYHPPQGTVVLVNFDQAFKEPEMVKPRLAVVLTQPMKARAGLCTVVPLSTSAPDRVMPYHAEIEIPFELPAYWGQMKRWVKGDMVYAAGFHRVSLLSLGKDKTGKRIYQQKTLPPEMFRQVQCCILHGLSMSTLTKALEK